MLRSIPGPYDVAAAVRVDRVQQLTHLFRGSDGGEVTFLMWRERPAQVLRRIALRPPRCNGIAKNATAILQRPFRRLELRARLNAPQAGQDF
jgi:hypothetical protein